MTKQAGQIFFASGSDLVNQYVTKANREYQSEELVLGGDEVNDFPADVSDPRIRPISIILTNEDNPKGSKGFVEFTKYWFMGLDTHTVHYLVVMRYTVSSVSRTFKENPSIEKNLTNQSY